MNSNILQNEQSHDTLVNAIEKNASAVMSHLSRGKWHMTKVFITREKQLPINIQIDQPVGVTFKLDFNKYIFQSVIIGLEPSTNKQYGGKIILEMPLKIECMQKRSYYRVKPPIALDVKTFFWHRGYNDDNLIAPESDCWSGSLVDLSAGGLQIGVDASQKFSFKEGQLVGIKFTPMPKSRPMILEGQIRHIAKTADEQALCLGIQIIGLEASQEGREKLKQLVEIVDIYHKINEIEQAKVAAQV